MFVALSSIGREQVAKGRRDLLECERWERRIQEQVFPTT